MILYGFWRSSATWRARIALAFKRCSYEYRPINLVAGEQDLEHYRAKNPMGQVPLLELVERGGRIVRIAQSLVIAEYLEERFPSPPLLPTDSLGRAQVRQVAEAINSGIQPLANTSVRVFVRDNLGADDSAWCAEWIARGLHAVEEMVRGTSGRFAFGDMPTLADVCIVPQLYHARRFAVDLRRFPTLVAVERACQALDPFSLTRPEFQIDAPGDQR
jgi:maleylpyruvate isomerase